MSSPRFHVVAQDELTFACQPPLADMYKLSPCVWREGNRFHLLLRVVNRSAIAAEKVARIHYGSSANGLDFELEEQPVLGPGEDDDSFDRGGCEDPTLAKAGDTYYVYYSGWNERRKRGELLLAQGEDIHRLRKCGIALASSERAANPKEATIVRVADGSWRLFFEYADEGASKIGLAASQDVAGPWRLLDPLFAARENSWDDWHLSTGPILDSDPQHPVMFYNGATPDAHWRVGWIMFNTDYTRVLDRSVDPLVLPHIMRNPDDTDIAFAASALEIDGDVHLYYSVADQYVVRALVRPA